MGNVPGKIGVTMGDPLGIGPEVVVKALNQLPPLMRNFFHIYGDEKNLRLAEEAITAPKISPEQAASLAITALDEVIVDLKAKKIAALVTAPVNKHRLQLVRADFRGHTEYLAQAFDIKETVMFFTSLEQNSLRIGLATTHIPLHRVSSHLTCERFFACLELMNDALKKYFHISSPTIAVLGLNPHAGEGGALGKEEETIMRPALAQAKQNNINVVGPFSADGFFAHQHWKKYDAVLAMYHDQGLIPMKSLYPDTAVNMTLGLPFLRISPGHGTAEDIAWQNQANPNGMLAAMQMAINLIEEIS